MSFTSWQFGIFAAIIFSLYYLPALRAFQVQILVVASILFYGYGQPELLPLLTSAVLGTSLFLALTLRDRRFWLLVGIAFNLLLLAFFKYKFLFFARSEKRIQKLKKAGGIRDFPVHKNKKRLVGNSKAAAF